MCNIVDAVKSTHSNGYVHRDVRMANIITIEEKGEADVLLIDWNFAAKSNTKFAFAGSYVTASDDILTQLIIIKGSHHQKKEPEYPMRSTPYAPTPWYEDPLSPLVKSEPKYDLISLVRSLYLFIKRGKGYSGSSTDFIKLAIG
ncbi:hypothetical protein GOP47_0017287 [Adiantum capillus-veneris]|uniref:Protein kinase domain-containing protein n=1 Tax=Adiantum capillus-veneris TaxID=13818 RepID=A0A9D4Z9K1_ADICA|nr:hypothetical protein GOP47_0017287 [Adiantum capillus-veneris]